eukprot:1049545-Pelagomonas_calceolata.AAC.1
MASKMKNTCCSDVPIPRSALESLQKFASLYESGQPIRFELMPHCNQPNPIIAGGCPGCGARNHDPPDQATSLPNGVLRKLPPVPMGLHFDQHLDSALVALLQSA